MCSVKFSCSDFNRVPRDYKMHTISIASHGYELLTVDMVSVVLSR